MISNWLSTARIQIDEEIEITIDYYARLESILVLTCISKDHVSYLVEVEVV